MGGNGFMRLAGRGGVGVLHMRVGGGLGGFSSGCFAISASLLQFRSRKKGQNASPPLAGVRIQP